MESPDVDIAALGRAIQRRREGRGWTRYRLARRAGMSDPYLITIEEGRGKRVGIGIVARIAHALGITTDQLLADIGLAPPGVGMVSEVEGIYTGLDSITRPAWLRMGHVLRGIQDEYAALQADEERRVAEEPARYEGEEIEAKRAAFSDEALAEQEHREADDLEPR